MDGAPDPRRAALVAELAATPRRLATAALSAERSARPARSPGEWTPAEVVGHLVAVERAVWRARLDGMLVEDEVYWTWVEPGPDEATAGLSLADALDAFTAAREATLDRVRALDERGWARTGMHATYGLLDVAALLSVALDHDEDHISGLVARAAAAPARGSSGPVG